MYWYWLLLLPFSWLYSLINDFIRLIYRLKLKRVWRAPIPIVIVGNLTAGGNGKTPVVIWLVKQLQSYGIRVGVVSRGYGGKSAKYPLLLTVHTTASEAGDEPVLIYQRTKVPVAVAPKRSKAVQAILDKNSVQIIISDDGLQHYALARDVEIVVIDGIRRFSNSGWSFFLPTGPIRERLSRLRSVDAVIVNGGETNNKEISMCLRSELAVNLLTNERREVGLLDSLVAMAGIGNPSRFFTTLKQSGAKPIQCIPLSDHRTLSISKIISFTRPGQTLIMTEKDAVKYRAFAKANWWYLPVTAELNGNELKYLLQNIISIVENKFKN